MDEVRRFNAEFVTVMGSHGITRQGQLAFLLDRTDVPAGLEFVREFGDPSGFHVVLYRVLPAPPGKPRPDDP